VQMPNDCMQQVVSSWHKAVAAAPHSQMVGMSLHMSIDRSIATAILSHCVCEAAGLQGTEAAGQLSTLRVGSSLCACFRQDAQSVFGCAA
jgi:hypothetical protein